MQKSSSLIVFIVFCGLMELAAPLALNIPPIPPNGDDSTITNSVESVETTRNAAGTHTSSDSSEPTNPTSQPTNCSNSSADSRRSASSSNQTARLSSNQTARLSSIQQHMLARLNLTQVSPRVPHSHDAIPAAALASYYARLQTQQLRSKEPVDCPDRKSTQYARTINLFTPVQYASTSEQKQYDTKESSKEPSAKEEFGSPVLYNLTFEDIELATSSRLWSIVLRLFKKKLHTPFRGTNPTESVKIFQVDKNNPHKLETLLAAKIIRSEDDEYVSFDITDGIKKWRNGSTYHHTLQLSVFVDTPQRLDTRSKLPPAIAFDVPTYGKSEGRPQRPQLVVETLHRAEKSVPFLNHSLKRRRKRQAVSGAVSTEYCLNNPTESNCCIRNLTVDIKKDLGLTQIVLPTTFEPNYCSGSCSNSLWSSANLATKNLQDIRRNNPRAAAEPCCVPHTMKPLSVLMIVNNRLVVEVIPNMIVTSCICR